MEGNKDESFRCLQLSRNAEATGDFEKAMRLAKKAQRLFPSKEAEAWISTLETKGPSQESDNSSSTNSTTSFNTSTAHQRKGHHEKKDHSHHNASSATSTSYTPEQKSIVNRILSHDPHKYYDILEVGEKASDSEIKKAYRKLALQVHPDKNTAPRSSEAFKLVGKAFAVLSDPEKRSQFDALGCDPESRGASAQARYQQQFQQFDSMDISPEELFEMFFNGGFGPGGGFRTTRFHRRGQHQARRQQYQATTEGSFSFLHLLPLLALLFLSFFTSYMDNDSYYTAFSPTRTSHYNTEKKTSSRKIPYYVNSRVFRSEYEVDKRKLATLEEAVETNHIQRLTHLCNLETQQKRQRIREARSWSFFGVDEEAIKRAQNIPLPNCDALKRFQY